jgi:hypothetical protein
LREPKVKAEVTARFIAWLREHAAAAAAAAAVVAV